MADARAGRLPDFVIVGEARCGSTTLWGLLAEHPSVFFPAEKELHFFSSYRALPDADAEQERLAAYRQLFGPARPDQRCGEATPNYLFDDGACARMRALVPGVRLVAILRDPVARAWSHYWHQVRRGREPLEFEPALAAEPERIEAGDALARARFSYLARGRYVESLRRYEQAFGREAICVLFLEELMREPAVQLARVCAHLGVDAAPLAGAALPHDNRAAYPRWPKLAALGQSLRRSASALGPGAERALDALGSLTRPLRVYSGQPRMREDTRRSLEQQLRESDLALAAWLGRPVPWSRDARG